MGNVIVTGSFNEINSRCFRFLDEASRIGAVEALLWSDALVEKIEGTPPKFSVAEREYVLDALRYVDTIRVVDELESGDALPVDLDGATAWAVDAASDSDARRRHASQRGIEYRVIADEALAGYPEREPDPLTPGEKSVIVTGCYDWFHSGHVRFFEEVSEQGDLYVVVGNDANLRLLKGEGHPMFPEDERRYMAQSIRFVNRALVSSGSGWMDAEPEIDRLSPTAYAVNEDGDKPEKCAFCEKHGLEYIVLKREPKPGLTRRSSTDLRGF